MLNLKGIIFDNLFIKIISIVFAVILWFSVGSNKVYEMDLTIPIEVRNIPHFLDIKAGGTGFINLRVSGRKMLLKEIPHKKITAAIDLSKARAGENIIQIREENINLPAQVDLVRIYPEEIIMELEPRNKE